MEFLKGEESGGGDDDAKPKEKMRQLVGRRKPTPGADDAPFLSFPLFSFPKKKKKKKLAKK